jgi:hypothetical protein
VCRDETICFVEKFSLDHREEKNNPQYSYFPFLQVPEKRGREREGFLNDVRNVVSIEE